MTDRNAIIRECIAIAEDCSAMARDTDWDIGFNTAKGSIIARLYILLSTHDQTKATPTQTEYGPEIACSGRPEWIVDDDALEVFDSVQNVWAGWIDLTGRDMDRFHWWDRVSAIRLPSSHPFYVVQAHNAKHGTQFKYWPGGDEAPGDYDTSQDVLLRNGNLVRQPVRWTHYGICQGGDIIGYTPKPCADADIGIPISQPDFVPCERTIRLCIYMIPNSSVNKEDRATVVEALEALLPKKDRAEELVEAWYAYRCKVMGVDHGGLIRGPENSHAKAFAEFLIAQGEIRG